MYLYTQWQIEFTCCITIQKGRGLYYLYQQKGHERIKPEKGADGTNGVKGR